MVPAVSLIATASTVTESVWSADEAADAAVARRQLQTAPLATGSTDRTTASNLGNFKIADTLGGPGR
jgi:hypothetical protein